MRIGEFAVAAGVSPRTIRFYDEIGLLSPAFSDARTGYRVYHPSQLPAVHGIAVYRSLGLRLSVIADLLREPSRDRIARTLEARRRELRRERARVEAQLALIEAELVCLDAPEPAPAVLLKTTGDFPALRRRRAVSSYAEADAFVAAWCAQADPAPLASGAIWHRCRPEPGGIACEALALFPMGGRVPAAAAPMPRARVASVMHAGGDEELPLVCQFLRQWVRRRGPEVAGPLRELYWAGDGRSVTEVQYPVVEA